jgi:hypothetical protein
MSKQRVWDLIMICAAVLVLSLLGLAAAFATRIAFTLDGLLLLMICLMMAGIFLLTLLSIAKEEGWLPPLRKKASTVTQAASAKPAGAQPSITAPPAVSEAGQPNQATHQVDEAASRRPLQAGPAKAGEGK